MFDGAAKGYVYADTAEECQALCQSATLGENCEFWIFGILNTYFSTTISVISDLVLLGSPVTTQ